MSAALEERIRRLEDIEAIRELKARYCDVCDADHDADRIVELFTEDGVWESVGGTHGRHEGRAAIHAAFRTFARDIRFSQHNVTNLVIDVDGDTASGTWHFTGVLDRRDLPEAVWALARYEERYRRVEGTWRIAHLRAVRLAHIPAPGFVP
jgi:uncharacterized protein (TIGR02246 family)